jgi:hypothetical protein
MNRIVVVVTLAALAAPQLAAAEVQSELRLSVAGGAGAAATDPCGYTNPTCGEQRLRVRGSAPLVLAGIRRHSHLRGDWGLRLGAVASMFYIAGPGSDSAQTTTGAGEIGIEKDRFALDVIAGLSKIEIQQDEMTDQGYSMMFGFTVSAKLSPQVALVGRLDLHAAMHGPIGSAFIDGGIEWAPGL